MLFHAAHKMQSPADFMYVLSFLHLERIRPGYRIFFGVLDFWEANLCIYYRGCDLVATFMLNNNQIYSFLYLFLVDYLILNQGM